MIGAASKPNFPGMFQRQQPVAGLNAPDQGGSVFCGINKVNARLVHRNRVEGCQDADIVHIGVRTGEPVTGDRGDRTGGGTEYDSRYRDRGTDVHGREYGTGMDAGAG